MRRGSVDTRRARGPLWLCSRTHRRQLAAGVSCLYKQALIFLSWPATSTIYSLLCTRAQRTTEILLHSTHTHTPCRAIGGNRVHLSTVPYHLTSAKWTVNNILPPCVEALSLQNILLLTNSPLFSLSFPVRRSAVWCSLKQKKNKNLNMHVILSRSGHLSVLSRPRPDRSGFLLWISV